MVSACFQREGFVSARVLSPHFVQEIDVYVLCVCVRTHPHTECSFDASETFLGCGFHINCRLGSLHRDDHNCQVKRSRAISFWLKISRDWL